MSGDNGKIINPSGDNQPEEQPKTKIGSYQEIKELLRIKMVDNLDAADEIFQKIRADFLPIQDVIIAAVQPDKKVITLKNPETSIPLIDHAYRKLGRDLEARIFQMELAAKKGDKNISVATKQDQHNILGFARKGFRNRGRGK